MAFDERRYQREWKRKRRAVYRDKARETLLAKQGKCLVCEILMGSKYHGDCPGNVSPPEHGQIASDSVNRA